MDVTIEARPGSGYDVYSHGVYENSSVLAGQSRRCWLDFFNTRAEAKDAYPDAVLASSTRRHGDTLVQLSGLPESPPDWFDPMAAGETW